MWLSENVTKLADQSELQADVTLMLVFDAVRQLSGTHYRKLFSVVTVAVFKSRLKTFLFSQAFLLSLLTNTLPSPSASEVTTLWRYANLFIIIIFRRRAEFIPDKFVVHHVNGARHWRRDRVTATRDQWPRGWNHHDAAAFWRRTPVGWRSTPRCRLHSTTRLKFRSAIYRLTESVDSYTVIDFITEPHLYVNCNLCYISFVLFAFSGLILLPSVLWQCWLGSRKGIRPVKNWMVECWCGYLSGSRCRLAYGPVDATATHCLWLQ